VSKYVRTTVSNYKNHTVTSSLRITSWTIDLQCHKLWEIQCHKVFENCNVMYYLKIEMLWTVRITMSHMRISFLWDVAPHQWVSSPWSFEQTSQPLKVIAICSSKMLVITWWCIVIYQKNAILTYTGVKISRLSVSHISDYFNITCNCMVTDDVRSTSQIVWYLQCHKLDNLHKVVFLTAVLLKIAVFWDVVLCH
jgi:hypothetical protein